VIALAERNDALRNGSVGMLEVFGNPKGISALKKIREKIKDDGSVISKMDILAVDEAIAHLEAIQKEQEQSSK